MIDIRGLRGFALCVVIAIGLVALALLFQQLSHVALLVLLAIIIAIVLRTVSLPLRHAGIKSERLLVLLGLVIVIVVLGSVGWLVGSEAHAQAIDAVHRVPQAWDALRNRLGLPPNELDQMLHSSSSQGLGQTLVRVMGITTTIMDALIDAVFVVVGGIFLAIRPRLYRDGVVVLVPGEAARARVGETLDVCARALRLWLFGQFVSMTLVGLVTGLGLWLIGMTAPLALGLLAALFQFVPLLGPIVAALPALLLAVPHGLSMVLWTLAVYLAVHQIETNIVTPLIQRRAVDLPPALTMFAIIAMGTLLGVLGFIVATPALVIIYVAVSRLWVKIALGRSTDVPGAT